MLPARPPAITGYVSKTVRHWRLQTADFSNSRWSHFPVPKRQHYETARLRAFDVWAFHSHSVRLTVGIRAEARFAVRCMPVLKRNEGVPPYYCRKIKLVWSQAPRADDCLPLSRQSPPKSGKCEKGSGD